MNSTPSQLPPDPEGLHPVLAAAAEGSFPRWTRARESRRDHMRRVAGVLDQWARARNESVRDRQRWVAVGMLHDVLRDEDHGTLRGQVPETFAELPGKILHGPAAAERLRREGVEDEEILHAIGYHTLGSPDFQDLGWALFAADFLEPGRRSQEEWRSRLRREAEDSLKDVVKEILSARIGYLAERGRPLHPSTLRFWNQLSEGQPWASASEL